MLDPINLTNRIPQKKKEKVEVPLIKKPAMSNIYSPTSKKETLTRKYVDRILRRGVWEFGNVFNHEVYETWWSDGVYVMVNN